MKNKADFLTQLALNIREQRKLQLFSQDSFAKHLKIARRNYCDIEAGKINPSILLLMKIALGLNVSLVTLIPEGFSLHELKDAAD
ncbi:MAG: helix-turn-helix transcriptional regulator [Pseudomonadota bacterium]